MLPPVGTVVSAQLRWTVPRVSPRPQQTRTVGSAFLLRHRPKPHKSSQPEHRDTQTCRDSDSPRALHHSQTAPVGKRPRLSWWESPGSILHSSRLSPNCPQGYWSNSCCFIGFPLFPDHSGSGSQSHLLNKLPPPIFFPQALL